MNDFVNKIGNAIHISMDENLPKIQRPTRKTLLWDENSINSYQFGFRQDRSTIDNLFVYSQIRKASDQPIVSLMVDLSAAFDKL